MSKALEVAAGVVFRDRRLLIARRRIGDHLGGYWEFPGGKRHEDETFEVCLRRELAEELGIEVEIVRELAAVRHVYPERTVCLRFLLCRWCRHEPQALGCAEFTWIRRPELAAYQFPPADAQVLDAIRGLESGWW